MFHGLPNNGDLLAVPEGCIVIPRSRGIRYIFLYLNHFSVIERIAESQLWRSH